MSEIPDFGLIVLFVSGIVSLALLSNKVSERFPLPAPAIFLLAAAVDGALLAEPRAQALRARTSSGWRSWR